MVPFSSGILTAVLPTLAYDNYSNTIWETAKLANHELMMLVTSDYDVIEGDDDAEDQKLVFFIY